MLPRKNASIPTPTSLPFSISHPNIDGYTGVSTANIFHHSVSPPSIFANASPSLASGQRMMYTSKSPQTIASGRLQDGQEGEGGRSHTRSFPKLPGFAPPVCLIQGKDAPT